MPLSDARDQIADAATYDVAAGARRALSFERAGRFSEAWREWERLRATDGGRPDWNGPLAASYLRFAFDWTADGSPEPLQQAEEALVRGVAILSIDLADQPDDAARLLLIARACEQRCLLRAYGEGWTRLARAALEAGEAPPVTGDPRQIAAAGAAATAALDLVAIHAPSLATLATELAQSCLRLAATLEASGDGDAANGLLLRAETVLRGPSATAPQRQPRTTRLVAITGCDPEERTEPRRPALRIVTSRTA